MVEIFVKIGYTVLLFFIGFYFGHLFNQMKIYLIEKNSRKESDLKKDNLFPIRASILMLQVRVVALMKKESEIYTTILQKAGEIEDLVDQYQVTNKLTKGATNEPGKIESPKINKRATKKIKNS